MYARAVVGLAEHMLHSTAAPASVFSNMSDESKKTTWERGLLNKALATRSIKVVEWNNTPPARFSPLRFPPHWGPEFSGTAIEGEVSVLLDFSELR